MGFAERVGQTFIENSYIEVAEVNDDDFTVGDAFVRDDKYSHFKNAVHAGYDDLNPSLELRFARELDKTGLTWCRNPSQSGYGIPIIQQGGTNTFYPDFLVWGPKGKVFAIDTKGSHLHADAKHKLVRIRQTPGRPEVHICFVMQGTLDTQGREVNKSDYTVLRFGKDGSEKYTKAADFKKAVELSTK